MAVIPKPKRRPRFINGKCTAIEDLGYYEAHYGSVRRVKYTFETDQRDDDGEPLVVHRVFNDDMCRTAWQRKAIHRILGYAIPNDKVGEFDRRSLMGKTCRIKLTRSTDPRYRFEVEIYGPPARGRAKKERSSN